MIAPVELHDQVIGSLRSRPGVTHIVVPAAGFAVVAASVGDWDIAAKSAAQLAINLAGITVAGVLVLAVRRRHARRPTRAQSG